MQAQTNLEMLMQEAPLPVMPVPQVNMSLVKSLDALTGIIENLWNPDAGPPPENLLHAIQESRPDPPDLIGYSCPQEGGGAALDAELDARQDPELWDLDEGGVEEMVDFEEAHAPGGPPVQATVSRARNAATRNTPITSTAEEDTHRGASSFGAGRCPVLAGPQVVSSSHAESSETRNFLRCRIELVRSSQHWQVPKILHRMSLCIVAWGVLQHAPRETLARLL